MRESKRDRRQNHKTVRRQLEIDSLSYTIYI